MEEKKHEVSEQKIPRHFVVSRFESSDYKIIFYSVIFIIGSYFYLMDCYPGVGYSVAFSSSALFLAVLIIKTHLIERSLRFWILNLLFLLFTGVTFLRLYEELNGFDLTVFISSLVAFSFIAFIKVTEDRVTIEKEKINNIEKLIEICRRSEGFNLLLIFNLWLIFFIMFQSWMSMIESGEEMAMFAIIYGWILSFASSLLILLFGAISITQNITKSSSIMLQFLVQVAKPIVLWIIASSVIVSFVIYLC